ncbi:MAG: hypothetical protein WC350_01630 [Candidatus Micrarchaeia archaeon]|jgi:hypothetical protein
MNIAFYTGTSFDLEEYKTKIIGSMGRGNEIIVAKRFPKPLGLANAKEEYIHSDEVFSRKPAKKEMAEAERSLGIPFPLLLRYWYNWDRKKEKNRAAMLEHYAAITQYFLYWRKFFSENRTHVFVTTYESTFPEIVSVQVARSMGIKVIYIYGGRVSGSLMLCDADCAPIYWKKITEKEKGEIYSMLRERYNARKAAENLNVAKDVRKYSDYSLGNIAYKLGRLVSYWRNYYAMPKMDRMRTISPFKLLYKYLEGQARQYYSMRLCRDWDYRNMNYFLFPLQFDDEANASYQEAFLSQFDVIKAVSLSLPINHYLIIKPHPHWKNRDIPVGRMKEMMALPNVRMISPDVSTIDLINGSKGVFIINSTPGYEAIVLGKPVVTFGHDLLFSGKEPVITVHDMNKLPGVAAKLANGGIRPDEKKAKELVARYYKHLIFLEGRFGMNRIDLTDKDAKKMARALEECISAIA